MSFLFLLIVSMILLVVIVVIAGLIYRAYSEKDKISLTETINSISSKKDEVTLIKTEPIKQIEERINNRFEIIDL